MIRLTVIVTNVIYSVMAMQNGNNTDDYRPSLIMVAFRPGLIDPKYIRTDNYSLNGRDDDYISGDMTTYGKRQAYALGKFLRARYENLIPQVYLKDEIRALSSSSEHSQTTMQMVLAGLFSNGKDSEDFDAKFASYEIDDTIIRFERELNSLQNEYVEVYFANKDLVRMSRSICPDYQNVVGRYRDDRTKEVKEWLAIEKPIVDVVSQEVGINVSMSNLVALGANIMHRRYLKQAEGQWTKTVGTNNLTNRIFDKLAQFADAPSVLCANDRQCRRLLAGYWINNILDVLRHKKSNESPVKILLFSSAVDSLLSAMKLLKLDKAPMTLPSGGFILEYRPLPEPEVRLISHNAEEDNPDKRLVRIVDLPFCENYDWCPLDVFSANVETDTTNDWRNLCKVRRCDAPLPPGKFVKSVDCPVEYDKSGAACTNWARHDYCNEYDTVRWLYCRRTCLCDPEFL